MIEQVIIKNETNRIREVIQSQLREYTRFSASNEWYNKIGINKKRFAKFLKNEDQPNLRELKIIAKALEVNPKDLFD